MKRSGAVILQVFQAIQNPVAALYRAFQTLATTTAKSSPLQINLNQLAAQGKRAGEGVQNGALAGAAGLRVLGVAGLGAFAAVTVLNKAMTAVNENAGKVFKTGVGAASAGMQINRFSGIAQALKHIGNVPTTETESWLAEMRQWQLDLTTTRAQSGRLTDIDQTYSGILGISDTPEQMLQKFARMAAALPNTEEGKALTVQRGRFLQLSPEAALALKEAGGRLAALTLEEQKRATTEPQYKSAKDLFKGSNNLAIAWENLSRILYEDINPILLKFYDGLAALVGLLPSKEKRDALYDATIAALPGGTAYLLWRKFFGGGKSTGATSGAGKTGATSGAGKTGHGGVVPSPSATPEAGAISYNGPGITVGPLAGYSDPATAVAGEFIAQRESGNRDVNNGKYNLPGARHLGRDGVELGYTAGGYHQILDSNWVKYARQLGIDTNKYPRAFGTPKEIQRAVFSAMYKKEGPRPWGKAAGGPIIANDIATIQARQKDVNLSLPLIRNSAAQAAAGVNSTSSTTYGGVNTGDINVYTQATQPLAVGGAVQDAVKRLAVQANTGLNG